LEVDEEWDLNSSSSSDTLNFIITTKQKEPFLHDGANRTDQLRATPTKNETIDSPANLQGEVCESPKIETIESESDRFKSQRLLQIIKSNQSGNNFSEEILKLNELTHS
jgi:hypothetical protein